MLLLKIPLFALVVLILLQVPQTLAAPNFLKTALAPGPRIINGTMANVNNTMHQVSVRRRSIDSFFFGAGHICGGSLISPNKVLSAAHCFVDWASEAKPYINSYDFIVVMGNLDRYEKNELTLTFDIEKIIFGVDQFDISTYERDIALLFLSGSVLPNHPSVKPICLNRKSVPAGTICQATGWGKTEEGYNSDLLKSVDIPTISNMVCDTEVVFDDAKRFDGMFCAGYLEGERDACDGDSGGPFVCNGVLTGIISWGQGCAQPKVPGVYTDVEHYVPWIEEQIQQAGDLLECNDVSNSGSNERGDSLIISAGEEEAEDAAAHDGKRNGAMSSLSGSITLLICLTTYASMFRGSEE